MFTIEVRQEPVIDGVVVRLRGEADVDSGERLEAALDPVAAGRPFAVVFDLSELEFINSMALGALVRLHGALKKHGGRVFAGGAGSNVAKVMEKTRMHAVFTVCGTVGEAMDAAESAAMS